MTNEQKVKDAASNLLEAIEGYKANKRTWRELAASLNEFIAIVLVEWPSKAPERTAVTRYRSYFMPGLSGGCT